MRVLYCIGCGELGFPVFRTARQLSFVVVGTDKRIEAGPRPDIFFNTDALDYAGHVENIDSLKKEGGTIAGIISMTDEKACVTVAALQEHFGLPGHGLENVTLCLDKRTQAEKLRKSGMSVPHTTNIPPGSVAKPAFGAGSVGTMILSEPYVIQEQVIGRHLDVNGLFLHGEYTPLGTAERWMTTPPRTFPVCGLDPGNISSEVRASAHHTLETCCVALGLTHGPVKADLILDEQDRLHVIEITPRFHGDIWTVWTEPLGSGIDPWGDYLRALNGDGPLAVAKSSNWAIWRLVDSNHQAERVADGRLVLRWTKNPPGTPTTDNRSIRGYEVWAGPGDRTDLYPPVNLVRG